MYAAVVVVLLVFELLYFKVADRFNIIDKPNERSSHKRIVLRGGGIIFALSVIVWSITPFPSPTGEGTMIGLTEYLPFIVGLVLAAGVSFIDDIHSLPDSVRLVVQFAAMLLMLWNIGIMQWDMWWMVPIALVVCVGCMNIFNFMDGINGITGGYSLAMLIPLFIKNELMRAEGGEGFVEPSLLIVVILAVLVFCFFNFREKAKCFAGDVGSIGMALILTFCIGRLMFVTGDITWIVLFVIYGVDGCMTIFHRIKLHENLGEAHRKHAYQLMANELKIPHVVVSSIYMVLQLTFSLVAIYVIPDTALAHWVYLLASGIGMAIVYILFMRKYYHLHEEYLKGLQEKPHPRPSGVS